LKRKMEDRKIRFDMGAIVYSFCVLIAVLLWHIYPVIAYPYIEFPK
jgi:hypothetical protein